MTISSSTRKAGPYTGNGVTTVFSFSFKVFTQADLEVIRTDLTGAESTLVLGTDYTVTLNANQNSNPGGNITMLSAPATGFKITITSDLAYTQNLDLTNQGGFYPTTINDALDRATIQIQQLNEQVSRSVKTDISSSTTPDQLLDQITQDVASASASATASAASAASALTYLNTFKGQYYGTATSDPAVDPLGNAPTAGDLYFNTTNDVMRVYNGTAWQDLATDSLVPILRGGTGATDAETAKANLSIYTSNTGSAIIPTGTQAQRDGTPATGYFRFNTTISKFEGYNGTAWGSVGGGASGGGSDAVFIENDQTVNNNYTITAGKNAGTFGPVTVAAGVTVTVPSGSVWTIV